MLKAYSASHFRKGILIAILYDSIRIIYKYAGAFGRREEHGRPREQEGYL
jgi:hypothetical protein